MTAALIDIKGLWREYGDGESRVTALKNINLSIYAGEMVAIIGKSGSGKSTLMNIMGCLDQPSQGEYTIAGHVTSYLSADELATLRREYFGFIFQRYHLLADLKTIDNIEIPALYAGKSHQQRQQQSIALLRRLGLSGRENHYPAQLSGGQQQRVSIARALINGGTVIFADEPTGALDSQSGIEVMKILKELHQQGHTIILVTHDPAIAAQADRIIEIADGEMIRDSGVQITNQQNHQIMQPLQNTVLRDSAQTTVNFLSLQFLSSLRMAVVAMTAHKLRTFLTMLGIIIGIASVVCVVAIGEGSRQKVLSEIKNLGPNTIEIWSGRGWGDPQAEKSVGIQEKDIQALQQEFYLEGVSPQIETSLMVRYGNLKVNATIQGVNEQYFHVKGLELENGHFFNRQAVLRRVQDVVIDPNTKRTLFGNDIDPIGKVILLGALPCRVVGVLKPNPALSTWFGGQQSLMIFTPYTVVRDRITGNSRINSLTVRVKDGISTAAAENAVIRTLQVRRADREFNLQNADSIQKTAETTASTLTVLISSIAFIALLVGGIGVMNIMLVSVSERTREIGIRMAVGARQRDILQQFLIEAILVCLAGGIIGVLMAFVFGLVFSQISSSFTMIYSSGSIMVAFIFALLVGVVFGYLPAYRAAKLNPIDALARE